ncbi:MAG: hypothetical protein ACRDON_00390 [Gaiellaceae bacterium]
MKNPAVIAPGSGPTIAARRDAVAGLYPDHTMAEIAAELVCNPTTIWKDVKALGLAARQPGAGPKYPPPPTDRKCAHCGKALVFRHPSDAVGRDYCSRECADVALAVDRRMRLAAIRYRQPKDELEAYKRQHGLRDFRETAAEIGCARSTLRRWLRDGQLVLDRRQVPTQRYPGPWSGNPPVLFPEEAIEAGRRLLAEAYRGRGVRMEAKWADGRITGPPRTGEERLCACGCGRIAYRTPAQLADGRERVFYSASCRSRYRWKKGIGVRHLVESWWGKSGRARQTWLGRWSGGKEPGLGARPRGRPPVTLTGKQRAEITRLAAQGWGRRAIASRVGVSPHAVRQAIAELSELADHP